MWTPVMGRISGKRGDAELFDGVQHAADTNNSSGLVQSRPWSGSLMHLEVGLQGCLEVKDLKLPWEDSHVENSTTA